MPLETVDKIWMDGEMVDWADAKIHILTHTLHYGSGVFEGIRAYATDRGPAIFRLEDHIRRLFDSAQIFMIDVPYTQQELVDATIETVRVNGVESCYIRPLVYLGYGEMGLNPLPCPVNASIAVWPWGSYLGDEGVQHGVRMKVSSWKRHDPNIMPPAAKGTGMYINSSMAKVEALKSGYDEAIMLSPQGFVSECTGENIFIVKHGRIITPPVSAGALEGITQASVHRIATDLGIPYEVGNILRSDLYTADEAFLSGTAAEVVPVRSVDDREIGEPGPITRQIQETYFAAVKGEDDRYKDWLTYVEIDQGEPSVARTPPVRDPSWPTAVEIFDTTLRDGVQFEGISVTVDDKLRICEQLDRLGVHWIEGGYPGANPRDEEFFRRAAKELELTTSTLVAFGSTRRPRGRVDEDTTLQNLVDAGTSTVCIVGKSWDYHVTEALRTTLDEGVAMVGESVRYLADNGLRVFFDAEHFFDGYKRNPEFALRVLESAVVSGVDTLVLCDTNGGSLPHEVERIVADVVAQFGSDVTIGMHTQNDTGCATANAIAGVIAGSTHVQGTINGYGERTGNCDLTQLVPNLTLKMGIETLPAGRIERLTSVSHHVAELVNLPLMPQQPYVGTSTFAHKAGLHTSAIARRPDSYEHIAPESVGNGTRFLVSDLSGRATVELKAEEFGVELDGAQAGDIVATLKDLEHRGYHFEVADGSLELLMRRASGWEQTFFEFESFRVIVDHQAGGSVTTEATVKVRVDGERTIATGEGNGPVNALDAALRSAIGAAFPELSELHLTDFKVRVIDTGAGTGAVTRVLIDTSDADDTWTTIGVSENIIEASWQALLDSVVYGLLQRRQA